MSEQWKPVYGWEGLYEVSDGGRVRSLDRVITTSRCTRTMKGRVLRFKRHGFGYHMVCLSSQELGVAYKKVSTLVAEAFHGPRPSRQHVVRHLDGDAKNDTPTNLQWGTQSENIADTKRHGRFSPPPINPRGPAGRWVSPNA